ncbi:MAG TPA: orotidine 5'-phosphate decarboxylase / HUMPS family protein [Solirubrobacteraceae bacterium]|nr:orotidine 5'-phosphate decarboxylase / HUMPS family protein [Solirubrobacteraceae bacterium]
MNQTPSTTAKTSPLGSSEHARSATRTGRKAQVALDLHDLPTALAALREVAPYVDIIEVGTVLCLSAGMGAVAAIRAAYPDHLVLADIRVAEAGSILSALAYDAGADWVTVVSGAAPEAFPAVAKVAGERGCDVQVELSDGWTWDTVERCRELGIRHFIFHRSRDAEALGDLSWSERDLDSIARVYAMGGRVSVTGGLTTAEVADFAETPVEVFIAGRGLYGSSNPATSAQEFAAAVQRLPQISLVEQGTR